MTKITKLSPSLWQISLPFQNVHGIVGSYLLTGKNELVILDPGPKRTETNAPPKNRAEEAARARVRSARRFSR